MQQLTPTQLGLHTRFYNGYCQPTLTDPCNQHTLLLHLVHLRINVLLDLERRIKAQDHSVRGRLSMVRRRLSARNGLDQYLQQLGTSDEMLLRQLEHWRRRHDTLASWAMSEQNDSSMLPPEYVAKAFGGVDSVAGMACPEPLQRAFREQEPVPLCERNLRQVQYERELHWRQTPQQYLLEHCPTTEPWVLVDFRQTVAMLDQHPELAPATPAHWFPQHDAARADPQGFCERAHQAKQDALNAHEQARVARRRKTPTYAEKVAEDQLWSHTVQRSQELHYELLHSLSPQFDPAQRNALLRERYQRPVGYQILRAVVHRVNAAQAEMKRLQGRLEQLELALKALLQPAPPPQADYEPPESTADYDPAKDDDGRALYELRMLRATERLHREASQRLPSSPHEAELRRQLECTLEHLHQWKRFCYSHLHLSTLLLDLEDPSDAVLQAVRPLQDEPSLLQQAYPYSELGPGEELLRQLYPYVMTAELVYGSETGGWADTDPRHDWHCMLKKIIPTACSTRDWAFKNQETCQQNPVYCDFVLESLQASLLGLYRHCRNPAPFDAAVLLYRCFSLARRWKPLQQVMLDVCVTHEELVINAVRENVSWQYRHDSVLWMIDNNWVMGCMHVVRGMFNKQHSLEGVHDMIVSLYGKHDFCPTAFAMPPAQQQQQQQQVTPADDSPAVYRTSNNNFLRYICDIFRYLDLKRILGSIWRAQNQQQKPTVQQLSPCASQMVSWHVDTKQPGAPIQTRWLRELGISEQGISRIELVYDSFVRRANEREVAQILDALGRVDYELCAQFFYTLSRHYACRHIALDADLAAQQLRVRRRIYDVPSTQPYIEPHLTFAFFCNTMACNELKHAIVQDTGNAKFYGTVQLLYDAQRKDFFCTSKKTVDMRQRNKQKVRAYSGAEPEFVWRARNGELDAFCLVQTTLDELFSGVAEVSGTAAPAIQIKLDGKKLRVELPDAVESSAPVKPNSARIQMLRDKLASYRRTLQDLQVQVREGDMDSLLEPNTNHLSTEQREQVKLALDQLTTEGKKEAKAIYKLKYHRPCYHIPAFATPLVGYVVAKEKQKDKQKARSNTLPVTICTLCGSVTHFSLAQQYSTNGCGVCDANERLLLKQPRCFICHAIPGLAKVPSAAANSGIRKDPMTALTFCSLRLLDDGPSGTGQYEECSCCNKCWRAWMGMPKQQVSYVRRAEGECRFLSRTEMLYVRSVPEWNSGPGVFYEYREAYRPSGRAAAHGNHSGEVITPEALDKLRRQASGKTIAQWAAM